MKIGSIIVLVLYLVAVFAMGIFKGRGGGSSEESYFTGNKTFGAWPTAISAGATNSSGWIFIGACGWSYTVGLFSMWMYVGFLLGGFLNYCLIAPYLRAQSKEYGALSVADLVDKKINAIWNTKGHIVGLVGAAILTLFFLPYMSTQLTSAGKTINSLINMDYTIALIFSGVFVVAYCFGGGYKSVIYTDLVQGLIMMAILIVAPIVTIVFVLGGWGQFWADLISIDPMFAHFAHGTIGKAGASLALGWVIYGIGTIGQPHVQQRFITAKDNKTLKSVAWIGVLWTMATMIGSNLIGLCGRILMPNLSDPEYVFPTMVATFLPSVVVGLVIAAIFAAIMSTYSSQLMVAVQSVVEIMKVVNKKDYSTREIVKISRIVMLVCGALSLAIALMRIDTVFALVNYAWSGVGAAFGPLIIFVLFLPRYCNQKGAVIGMLTGSVISTIWYMAGWSKFFHEIVPGMIAASLTIYLVTKITSRRASENV
ncbi:sodium/proline symporter [Cloacibacillus porcorum]|jgi:sodium/proline symporter